MIDGDITKDELRQVYKETVDVALEHAEVLIEELDGKSVITADHGEMLAERACPLMHIRYGHPHDVSTRELRVVPWLEIESESHREIVSEPPTEDSDLSDDVVEERLEMLGYK